MRRCSCGKVIKTKNAKVCQSCRSQQYKKMADKIIEKRMRGPKDRVVPRGGNCR